MHNSKMCRTMSCVLLCIGIAIIAAVSWHSVQELHYLKTFFPSSFTSVTDTGWAAVIELIKVFLVAWPILLVMKVLKMHMKHCGMKGGCGMGMCGDGMKGGACCMDGKGACCGGGSCKGGACKGEKCEGKTEGASCKGGACKGSK